MCVQSPQRWFWMPAAVFALGTISIVLLVWINQIGKDLQRDSVCSDTVMEMQIKLAVSHLWLEQYIAGDVSVDMEKVWGDVDRAIVLADTLLNGGKTKEGLVIEPFVAPDLRSQVEAVGFRLAQFKGIALERFSDPEKSGIGTLQDERLDAVFRDVIAGAGQLSIAAERDEVRNQIRSKRLFFGILAIWISIVIVAVIGFWNRELQKKIAEKALLEARDELEQRVEERTRDLTAANEYLLREVSKRRRAEESLRLYEEVVNNMPIGLYVFHLEDFRNEETFRMIASNPLARQFTGSASEEVLGKTIVESFSNIFEKEIPGACAEVFHSRKAKDLGEIRYGDENIAESFFSGKAFPLPNDCVGVIFENITERKRAEESLRESERKFRRLSLEFHTLLDAIPDRLTLLSPDFRILWANKSAAETAGLDVAELTGKYCYEVWHGSPTPCEHCPARKSFVSGRPEFKEFSTPEEEFWSVTTYPILDGEGKVISVIDLVSNVTERVAFQAEAMRAAHLASLGELAAGVAHEVNNPINCVINYAQILANKSQKETEQNEISNRIIKEGMRIAGIVRGLLSFARERKEEKAPVRVGEILKDSLALTESIILKQGIRIVVDMPADLPEIVANPQQIQQVFLNIISNARYALNERYPDNHENKVLEIRGNEASLEGRPCVNITFHDQGTGIPANIIEKIMLPFFSTKPTGKGTGLGLCISHGIVNDHGGRIMVHSVEGERTEVVVALPAKDRHES